MKAQNDSRLISLDFVAECGEHLASFGAAICAAAASENVKLVSIPRQSRGLYDVSRS